MSFGYLAALLLALAGAVTLDLRLRLFLGRSGWRAAITLLVGVTVLLAADVAAIQLGIFRVGDSVLMTGIMLAPHLPLEEPVFLVFLCQLTMVLVALAARHIPSTAAAEAE